jgi:hypothetical protein
MISNSKEKAEAEAFWVKKEMEAGGAVIFRTYATFLGTEGGKDSSRSGLAYATADAFFFEGIPSPKSLFGMIAIKTDYEPFSLRIDRDVIEACRPVAKGKALAALAGRITARQAESAGWLSGFMSLPVVCLELRGRPGVFLEALDWKGLTALLDPRYRSKK